MIPTQDTLPESPFTSNKEENVDVDEAETGTIGQFKNKTSKLNQMKVKP